MNHGGHLGLCAQGLCHPRPCWCLEQDSPAPGVVFDLEWKFKKRLMRNGVLSEVPKDPEIIH